MTFNEIFSGIGSQILGIILTMVVGGFFFYKISIKQKQKGGNNTIQNQSGISIYSRRKKHSEKQSVKIKINQIQKAGDDSQQTQAGVSYHDE